MSSHMQKSIHVSGRVKVIVGASKAAAAAVKVVFISRNFRIVICVSKSVTQYILCETFAKFGRRITKFQKKIWALRAETLI